MKTERQSRTIGIHVQNEKIAKYRFWKIFSYFCVLLLIENLEHFLYKISHCLVKTWRKLKTDFSICRLHNGKKKASRDERSSVCLPPPPPPPPPPPSYCFQMLLGVYSPPRSIWSKILWKFYGGRGWCGGGEDQNVSSMGNSKIRNGKRKCRGTLGRPTEAWRQCPLHVTRF